MNPEQLVECRKACVKKGRLSEKRRKAVETRRDRQPESRQEEGSGGNDETDNEDGSEVEGDVSLQEAGEILPGQVRSGEVRLGQVRSGQHKGTVEQEVERGMVEVRKYGLMSKTSWRRYCQVLEHQLDDETEVETADIIVKLVLNISMFDSQKVGVGVSVAAAQRFLEKRLSKYSSWQLQRMVGQLRAILVGAREPELLLDWLFQHLMASPTLMALLGQAGLVLEERLLLRVKKAVQVANRLAVDFMTQRRSSQAYAKISSEHAVATVREAGLSSEVRGDATILSLAVRWGDLL